jgi:eukaryotic-like serine/threonine-protein kinase
MQPDDADLKALSSKAVSAAGASSAAGRSGPAPQAAGALERVELRSTGHFGSAQAWLCVVAAGVVVVLIAGGFYYRALKVKPLTAKDTIVLADFDNKTADPVFDDTLKTALSVSLNQSPFLNVLSDSNVAKTLKLMTKSPDTKLTRDVARELCLRAGSKAYIAGSIASLGSQYVLGLKVVNCHSGDVLAQEQVTAARKEKVLDALGETASKLRGELGESLSSVQKLDVPLSEATTSSLEALQAYSLGRDAHDEKGPAASLPYDQRAIELDPNFATGYNRVAIDYSALGEAGRASDYFSKAFALRDHASEREKFRIAAEYYGYATGELEKAEQTYQEWINIYPQDRQHTNLGIAYVEEGQYEKALEEHLQIFEPGSGSSYTDLADELLALQQFDEARQMIEQEHARHLDDAVSRSALYAVAFLRGDVGGMAEQQQWFAGKPEENFGLSLSSDTEAYAGHLGKARELTKRSVDSAIRADSKENGAIWLENSALREAAYGSLAQAKQSADEGLKLVSTSQAVEAEATLAYAMAGETARAESLAQDLNKRYPVDTQMQSLWLPAARSASGVKPEESGCGDYQPATCLTAHRVWADSVYHEYLLPLSDLRSRRNISGFRTRQRSRCRVPENS